MQFNGRCFFLDNIEKPICVVSAPKVASHRITIAFSGWYVWRTNTCPTNVALVNHWVKLEFETCLQNVCCLFFFICKI